MAEPGHAVTSPGGRVPPRHPALPCSSCGLPVDPLRAARVAIFAERFHYFCSAECRARFVPSAAASGAVAAASTWLPSEPAAPEAAPKPPVEAEVGSTRALPARDAPPPARPPASALTLALAFAASAVLVSALGEVAPAWVAAALVLGACLAWIANARTRARTVHRRRVAFEAAAPLAASATVVAAFITQSSHARSAVVTAGAVLITSALSLLLASRGERRLEPDQKLVDRALSPRAPSGAAGARDPRPGEELVLEAHDRSPVDALVVAGRARVEPWCEAPQQLPVAPGDAILAGARVTDGVIRAVARWVGPDRAWARLTRDPERRADEHAASAGLAGDVSTGGAALAAVAGGLAASFTHGPALVVAAHAAAAYAALGNVALRERTALIVSRAVHEALRQGAIFKTPAALDRAGRVTLAIFCARGTLLRGEYDVASIEPVKGLRTEELLALAAGAHAGATTPIGEALQRSARDHHVVPDATRSHKHRPGLGVTAVSSSGRALVVGTRALLLESRISVASAEARITELETLGREVLLIALDGDWVGLVAVQDRTEPGARGAVQRLLDAGVEPVWLSGDARETSRALARHMGIDHVRPEVLPDDRGSEVRRLSQVEGAAAVIGRSGLDDAALAAAPLSIDLAPSGGPLERWDIEIVSGDVRTAAATIATARRMHLETRRVLLSTLIPAAAALLFMLLGAPAWIAPLAPLAGIWLSSARSGPSPHTPGHP